jgi:hypothetical protein
MAGLFQPKRVQVPGLLSDEGLAVALKNLSDTTKQGAEAAPPNTSAIEAADRITTEALKPEPGLRSVQSRISGQELSLSPEKRSEGIGQSIADYVGSTAIGQGAAAIAQAGALNPEQQAEEQKKIVEEAEAAGKAVTDTAALRDDVAEIIDRGRTGEGLMASQEELAAVRAGQSAQEASKATAFLKEAESTKPTQQWWLNAAQVGARSAIQMGSSALRYPADVWDTLDAIEKGSDTVKKSEVSIWLDGVDKALTKLLPGDKARSKQFVTELSAGAGSMVGFMVTGWAGRTIGLPAALTTGTLGAAVEGDSLYQEADTFGATATQKLIALFAGSALGTTEAIPIDRAFMRADVASGGMIRQLLANTVSTSLEEFIQEASQTLGEDIIAKYGAAYDPNREINVDDIMRAGVIGAITGGTVGAATTLLSNGEEVDAVGMDEAQITEAVDAALAQESQRFASIIGDELDGEGEVAAQAQGTGEGEAAGSQAAAAGPDPVVVDPPRGDAVQEIVKPRPEVERQVSPEQARRIDVPVELPSDPVFAEAVKAVPGAEITPDGLLIDLVRFQKPEQEGATSVRTGVFYLPKGSSNARHYKTGGQPGQHYGGSVKVEGKTLIKRPLFVKGATGGKAPEAAFVALNGKEAFAKLERDIMHVVGGQSALRRDGLAEEAVYNLLNDYGADGDLAYEIVANSSKGNQLRYALQENIIAHAVREAGYDAVVGHSKGKSGPFISEVFDVREIDYPVPGGEATLHPMFEAQQANLVTPDTMVAAADPTPNLDPLPGATGKPDPKAVQAVMAYSAASGLPITRQTEIRPVTPGVTAELSALYTEMQHQPADPAVVATYQALVEEVSAQYAFAVAANGGDLPPYPDAPVYPAGHPLAPVADQFWSLYQFFGTGLEGATDPENMWQAYARVFSASARPAFTTETRGPTGWSAVNGVPAPRKIGLMRSMAWEYDLDAVQAERMEAIAPAAQTETAAFKKWFGESKVVDAEGRPLVVFHGGSFASDRPGAVADTRGPGMFFTDDVALAAGYTRGRVRTEAYLRLQNPFDPRNGAHVDAPWVRDWIDFWREEDGWVDRFSGEDMSDGDVLDMIEQGRLYEYDDTGSRTRWNDFLGTARDHHDGYMGPDPTEGAHAPMIYVAFEPTQIKSAIANVGTFDPNDPAIDRMTGTATVRQPYLAEPTRPTKGIPTPSPAGPHPEDVRLSSISRDFVKVLRLTARHGRLAARDSSVMGEYNRRTAAIRLRTWTDLSTLVHEGGHALNDSMSAPLTAFVQANLLEIKTIARTFYVGDLTNASDETVRREGFAEFFRVYTLNPRFARNRWPQLVDAFEQTLRANDPQILDGLGSISAQFDAWLQLPSKQLIRNMIVDGRRESGIQAAVKELKDQGFKTWMHEHARRATSAMLNKYVAVADLEAQLLNLGEQNRGAPLELQYSESPTAILRLARNSGSRAQVQITDGVIGYRSVQSISRGLREALMTALGIPPDTTPGSLDENLMKDFDAYLVARRAWDEFRRFDAGEIERPPIGAQKGDVVRTIKEYEQSQPQFIPAAQIVHEYGMAMWQKRFDAGLMDKDTYEEGLQRQFYAPLQRDVSDKQGTGADSIGFGSSVLTKGPRFRGSDRDIISPMTVLMQMTFALEKQIAENDAKRALAVLADRAGQAGALVERIPASQLIGQSFSVQQVAQRLTADAGLTAADASDLMTILAGSVDKGDLMTLFRSEQAGTQGENVIFFWENGKVAAIRLNDSSLAADVVNTMNAVGRENMDVLLEGVAATSTVFRTAITSWPDFLIVNYIRDQMSAWILGGTGYVPFATGIQGISDEIRQKQWAKSYNAAGGTLGGMTVAALHRTRVDRDIKALRAKGYTANVFGDADGGWSNVPGAIKGLARLTALTETGTRLGLYRGAHNRAIEDGLSEYDASVEAAYIATDYIDFGLNGSKMLHVRRLVPFLNAQLQGLYKMYRTLGGDEVARRKGLGYALSAYFKNINNLPLSRLEQQQLRTGRAAWLKMMALGLIGAAIWALFKDDPDYQEAGEYLRTTGWVIPTGDGKIFYIPKPFELAIVSNAVERGLEFATGDSTAIDRFKRGLAMTLVPPTAPPAIQSVVEVAANFDFFTGREVVPSHMQALAPQLQYDNYTSSIAKWIGGATGQSPLVVDHIMSGLGASAYRDISTMLNVADPTRPMPDETEWPILRRFVRDVRRGSTSAQDFWAQASNTNGKLERGKATYKQYMEMGNQPAANRVLSTLNADERAYAILMTDFKPEEKRLNPFYRARQVTSIVSDMRRQNSGEGLEDTTLTIDMSAAEIKAYMAAGNKLERFQISRGVRTRIDDILSELARREVRNTMIATGQPGWAGKEVLPLEPTLDMLLAVSPDTYDEYQRRRVKAKVYDAQSVYDYWPEVRDRLNSDGPDAVLSDAVAVAGVVF